MTVQITAPDAEGAEQTYVLEASVNAGVKLETTMKERIGTLLAKASELDYVALRGLAWWLLQKHHAADFKTHEQVGDFIDRAGGTVVFFRAITALGQTDAETPAPSQEA